MAATQSSTSTSTPSSLASRRPQARTALPPFTLPPQPSFPRAAVTAADSLSPPTSAASASGSTPRQPSASPSYSAESSPGYSTGATVLAHPHRAASLSPFQPHLPQPTGGAAHQPRRLAPRPPGPLSHPHDPKVTSIAAIANAAINNASIVSPDRVINPNDENSTSPRSPPARRPLPGSPGTAGQVSPPRPAPRLPPIASIISPLDRTGLGRVPVTVTNLRPWERPLRPATVAFQVSPIIQDRPFPCDMCSQRFSRNHDLKRHKRIHIAAKPFPCPTCDKKFSRSDALKRHRLVKACHTKDGEPLKEPPPSPEPKEKGKGRAKAKRRFSADATTSPPATSESGVSTSPGWMAINKTTKQVEIQPSPESEPSEPPENSGSPAPSPEDEAHSPET